MEFEVLDVGCGDRWSGDVNVDLWVGESPHLGPHRKSINPKNIPNFVKADANSLPFKDKSFNRSVCSHLLEHEGIQPIKVIKELVRVTRKSFYIEVPHRFRRKTWLRYSQSESHARLFSGRTLEGLLRRLGLNPLIKPKYREFPSPYFPLIRLPWAIMAEIRLKE